MDLIKTLLIYMALMVGSATETAPALTPLPMLTATPVPTAYAAPSPQLTATALPTVTPGPYTTLYTGDRGEDVRRLQQRLSELGYLTDKIDGIYGQNTRQAVERFQSKNGLKPDGVAGKITQTALYDDPLAVPAVPQATEALTEEPTPAPTDAPTAEPSPSPTLEPADTPTAEPTKEPTPEPTNAPTIEPTFEPTDAPTAPPTREPTPKPSATPTAEPTKNPTPAPTEPPIQEMPGTVQLNESAAPMGWYKDQQGRALVSLKALADNAGWTYYTRGVSAIRGREVDTVCTSDGVETLTVDGQSFADAAVLWQGDLLVDADFLAALGADLIESASGLSISFPQA